MMSDDESFSAAVGVKFCSLEMIRIWTCGKKCLRIKLCGFFVLLKVMFNVSNIRVLWCVCVYIYIYLYLMYLYIYVCIYIYVFFEIYFIIIYIYIYMYNIHMFIFISLTP